jgi:hypothetical protein
MQGLSAASEILRYNVRSKDKMKHRAKVDYYNTQSRRAWMKLTIPDVLQKEKTSITLPQLAAKLDMISNPSNHSSRRYKREDWEYHIGVDAYDEVGLVLKRLVAAVIVEVDSLRRTYDPKQGRLRYAYANPLIRLAGAASEDPQTPSEPAGLLLKA